MTVATDERKALATDGERAQRYLDIAGVIVVTIDADQTVTLINRRGCEVLGYDREDILGENWFDRFVPEADRERTRLGFAQLMGGDIQPVEYFENPVLTRRGEVRIVAWHNTVLRDEDGRIVGTLSTGLDITERQATERALEEAYQELETRVAQRTAALAAANKTLSLEVEERRKLEEALRRSEVLHRTVLSNISDAVFITEDSGRFTYICPNVDVIFGYSREETEQLGSIEALIGGALFSQEDLFASLELRNIEREIHDKYGNVHILLINVKNVSIEGGTVLFTCRDITERNETRRQLETALAAAEEANRAKSQFLANMSHELRTPLNAILGFTHLVLDGVEGPTTEAQARSLERVDRSARNLLHLVDELLDLSRIDAGKVTLSPTSLELKAHIESLVSDFRPAVERKGLKLSYKIATNVPATIVCDFNLLRQVLANLIENSVKFTDCGTISLLVQLEPHEEGEVCLRFSVIDTGIGIPQEAQAHIFEPFFQAHGPVPRASGGTGLGLAISSRIVERMGGRFWVDSVPGEGSAFHFTARFPSAPVPVDGELRPRVGTAKDPVR